MKFLVICLIITSLLESALGCGINMYLDGQNCICYSGYQPVLSGVCCPPNEGYVEVIDNCDCLPTYIRDPESQTCVCPPFQTEYNPNIGCECIIGLFDDSTGHCCPANEMWDGTQCNCLPSLNRDANGVCGCTGFNEEFINNTCQCQSGSTRLLSGLCCSVNEYDNNGVCTCNPTFQRDPQNDLCSCSITQILSSNNTCQCRPEYYSQENSTLCCHMYEHEVNGACVCLPSLVRNPVSLECMCGTNEVFRNTTCDCITTFTREPLTGVCCGPNEMGDGQGSCICEPSFVFGPITNKCLCPDYEFVQNGTCVCLPGFVRNNDGNCTCPPGEILEQDSCVCNATKNFVRDPTTRVCGCGPRQILVNDVCICATGFIFNNATGQCVPMSGESFELSPPVCSNHVPPLNCTEMIPYRAQNISDAIHNLFGRIFNIVERNIGNINLIVVQFYNEMLKIMGDTSPNLRAAIAQYIATTIPSCPYNSASISSCSNVNITLLADSDIYVVSENFGMALINYFCP